MNTFTYNIFLHRPFWWNLDWVMQFRKKLALGLVFGFFLLIGFFLGGVGFSALEQYKDSGRNSYSTYIFLGSQKFYELIQKSLEIHSCPSSQSCKSNMQLWIGIC